MATWTQVAENLVRHLGGTIYLRAKVGGKVIRVSLETKDLRIAKIKRDDRLAALRAVSVKKPSSETIRTLGEAVARVGNDIATQPQLKANTLVCYKELIQVLEQTLPVAIHARSWTATEAAAWWQKIAERFAPQRANNVLGMAKRVTALLVEAGVRTDDPTAKLTRMRIHQRLLELPSRETMAAIIDSIRAQKGRPHAEESANYVAFLAYAGCRHGQAKAFRWEHVEKDWVLFPSGISGTKGARTRKLPIFPALRELLSSMRTGSPTGLVFGIECPRLALASACRRMMLPHMRLHDLRHFFATYAIECGVDIPTVAKWLGHKDGGVLAMRTYGHSRDEHSLSSAAKLK